MPPVKAAGRHIKKINIKVLFKQHSPAAKSGNEKKTEPLSVSGGAFLVITAVFLLCSTCSSRTALRSRATLLEGVEQSCSKVSSRQGVRLHKKRDK